jgi:UDP-3-O-[3-hydroxymyristoyl] glucosamine N-acyltransferase
MRLDELARRIGATVEGDGAIEITSVAAIEDAADGALTFVANPRYRRWLTRTRASAVVVGPGEDAGGRTVLRAPDPYGAFARALALFDRRPRPPRGVHPTAVVAASARIGDGASIGAYTVVGEDVAIGRDATLHPHVTVYPGARIGDRFTAHAGAVVRECVEIGDDVVLQPGAVVGGDGFGYIPRGLDRAPEPISQVGTVVLGDRVEIGANATVDRAAVGATRLDPGVKLDNLVMVAHGCRVGANSLLAAQTGLEGSTTLGRGVMTGGQVGFAGHCDVGDGARIAAQSGVAGDVAAGQTVGGSPAVDIALWRRCFAALLRLPDLVRRVRALERATHASVARDRASEEEDK